jgi:hypothetical protein
MSKITNVRLPNAVSNTYDPSQFNQLVRSLEQVVLQLNSTYGSPIDVASSNASSWFGGGGAGGGFAGGVAGFQNSNGIILPNAMLISDQDQTNASITGENLLTYNTIAFANGITVKNNSQIWVTCPGQYLVTFTLQVSNRGNAAQVFEVWAKDTGTNYPLSATRFDIPARKSGSVYSHIVPAITGIFTVQDTAVDYLEIAWWSDSLDVYIEHYAEQTSPTRPAIPSVILTINFISAV